MKYLAPGVWRLKELPAPSINVYLAEDVLIDAGRRWDRRRIFAELEGREISMVALTHAHPDHQGVAKDVCEARGVPLACHADDVEAMEGKRPMQEAAASNPVNQVIRAIWQGPPYKVERVLAGGRRGRRLPRRPRPGPRPRRGDLLPRARPGGDLRRRDPQHELRHRRCRGIKEPPPIFTYDMAENRRSIRKLAELNPALILPGHGPAVTDIAAFERFVAALPA